MNAHHAFDCPHGGFLLIGMAEAHSQRSHTQQLLLYKLKAGICGHLTCHTAQLDLIWTEVGLGQLWSEICL